MSRSRQRPDRQRSHSGAAPLGVPTRFLIDQIRSIDTPYVDGEPVAYLEQDEMAEIERAVFRYLGLGL